MPRTRIISRTKAPVSPPTVATSSVLSSKVLMSKKKVIIHPLSFTNKTHTHRYLEGKVCQSNLGESNQYNITGPLTDEIKYFTINDQHRNANTIVKLRSPSFEHYSNRSQRISCCRIRKDSDSAEFSRAEHQESGYCCKYRDKTFSISSNQTICEGSAESCKIEEINDVFQIKDANNVASLDQSKINCKGHTDISKNTGNERRSRSHKKNDFDTGMYSIRVLREVHRSNSENKCPLTMNSKCAEKVNKKDRSSVTVDKVDDFMRGATHFELSSQNPTSISKQGMKTNAVESDDKTECPLISGLILNFTSNQKAVSRESATNMDFIQDEDSNSDSKTCPSVLEKNVSKAKRRRRRRPKRQLLATTTDINSTIVFPTHSESNITSVDNSSCSHSSCTSLELSIDSRSSSAERLRLCSSPDFVYDPEVASQIPFYFKEPVLEDSGLPHFTVDFNCNLQTCEDGDDERSTSSWTEFDKLSDFDVTFPDPLFDLDNCEPSECLIENTTGSVLTSNEEDHNIANLQPTSPICVLEPLEIDYDSYLPAHVLMHVKRDLVSVLMEYGQTREVKVSFKDMERSGPHHASRFHTAAVVDGETFPTGSGSSKKNAKKAAAAQALKIMYDRGRKNLEVVNEMAHKKLRAMSDEEVGSHAHRVVLVSRHVLDTAEETQFINYSKDKIAAAFVLEYHGKMRVVGLGTGNRCILYQHMTLDGKRIIHSHAEIIARRAFLRYLYKQLQTYNGNRSHPIFTRSDTGKLKIRDKIQVHLYISRPPCGDAAAFPTISNFPNKMRAIRKQGQLRTIIDDGEGAIPTDFPVPAGANGKERLRIMTCSDKICRWNVLGVQGALLSHFLDPIYINSLVIGSHTGDQRGHVPRAVSGRLKCGRLHEVIQRPYRINTPDIHYPHDDLADNYNITKSKQYCITWSYGDIDAEVIDAITGVTNMEAMEEVIPSRVSKITLYQLFQQVCKRYGRHDLANLEYLKAKRSATTFQRMKSFVGQHLAAMGFGQWYSLQETYGTDSLKCPGPC
ncbi:uncharacterized protein LOC131945021 isoform X1 [Physella acuta]|uniref:uncharacterized protein LOC131945021 isoform X1 n=1 Tax=Physella acuta TaxID=109671 RepID=UPI0027DC9D8F|nr:uncharacterized protein LOC131945021 isoform X1 [Physella acuta]